jgi:serpin B
LFIQSGFSVRPEFIKQVGRHFDSEVSLLNFKGESGRARSDINNWVAERTHDRIRDLLPNGQPDPDTKLALFNAIYVRAAWANRFEDSSTIPEPFHLDRLQSIPVPTMRATRPMKYAKRNGYTVVTLPYIGEQLQFVLIVPDSADGLSRVEDSMTEQLLEGLRDLKVRKVNLRLPKFELEPDVVSLVQTLQGLGMHTAFDQPEGSANFDGIAPRMPSEYLYVGPVMHKAWLSLDEQGTEAAAVTAVIVLSAFGITREEPPPIEVRADRPFMFAIQHVESGACLFLGRVTDPR